MHQGIAVDFRCRSLHEARSIGAGELEHVARPDDIGERRLDRIRLIRDGRCRAGEIENAVDAQVDGLADVVQDETVPVVSGQFVDMLRGPEIKQVKIFMVVVLPAPFGPNKPTTSPFFIEKETSFTALF
jgi:hypothetical protein